jgi:hypothetical protein
MTSVREHQAQVIQPLVITPSPFTGESLPGFILRTAERNGYGSPMKLLHYAGMDDNEARSVRPSLEKLAPLFGKTAEELKATGLDTISQFKGRYVQIMGHSIPSMFTSCKHASVCLECVKEHGYIDGFHELKYALLCPKHQVKTVRSCATCYKPLSWHRAGLTKCSCGAELTQSVSEKVTDPSVLALLGTLYAKLMRHPLNQAQMDGCGFPKEAMEQLSIQTLLSVIYRFGLFNDNSKVTDVDLLAVKITAEVFSNWPHKFHDYLEEIHAPGANLKFNGLRAQFNSFYESFFKNIAQDQELQFMRDAFISFGQERWKQAAIHPSFVSSESANVVGINALSRKINMHPSTIRKMVTRGLIKVQGTKDCQVRNLFDLTEQQQFAFAEGKSFSIKKAAEILNIPVEILRAYRARGYYQAKYLAAPIVLFHERDVELLQKDLMQGCELCKVFVDKKHIMLAQIMRMKTTAEIKAAFIAAVIKRVIVPIGKLSDKPSGLVFDKAAANHYLHQLKENLQGGMSFEEAKNTLEIDRDTLFSLINTDVLQYRYQDNAMRIVEDSATDFEGRFISCHEVARMKAMTQSSLINLCHSLGINVYQTAQTDFFKPTRYWIDNYQLSLLGINIDRAYDYAKVA